MRLPRRSPRTGGVTPKWVADAEVMFWIGGPDLNALDRYSRQLTESIKDPKLGTTDVQTQRN